MKNVTKILALVLAGVLLLALCCPVFAAEEAEDAPEVIAAEEAEETEKTADSAGSKAWSAAILVAVVAGIGAAAMSVAIAKATGSMARQPEISGKINSSMMLGLVFIETAIIYALIVAILIIFVL